MFGAILYVSFNALAVLCNVFGRLTLTQIFGYTSIYAFAQTLSLPVFVRLVEEAFLLQIQSSRVRKGYPDDFDFAMVIKGISRVVVILAGIIWLITFTTNINCYNLVYGFLDDLLTTPRTIGNISFTFGGILLFLVIIWLANFLQKCVSYFFGDTGDDTTLENKSHRSRLVITRLVLINHRVFIGCCSIRFAN